MQPVAGQLFELFGARYVHGDSGSPMLVDECEFFAHAGNPRFFDKQGDRLASCSERPVNDFR